MSFCTNPNCVQPQNSDDSRFCRRCGKLLLLKDRYRAIRPIGSGGFGRAFLALDQHIPSQPNCVIKQFYFAGGSGFRKAIELFHQEAVHLDNLQHPQIPKLLAHFEQEQELYLVEEFITGQNLAQELRQKGVFSESQIWQVLKNLLPVLVFIHSQKVIHRDIKPANIMRRTPSGELVLIDFGIAKQITAGALLHTGTSIGSPEYMSPEQVKGKALPASDLYSLGVTCINLLTSISPFNLFDITSDRWAWRDYLPNGNLIDNYLGQILDKLLQNALSERYETAAQALQALTLPPPTVLLPQRQKKSSLTLSSQVGINYKELRELLTAKKWQAADKLTWVLMCQALSKPTDSFIFPGEIDRFPCEDLLIIDQLWTKYSQGHFGFSIQKQIYENCNHDYGQFCAAVGWNLHQSTSSSQKLSFQMSAPTGHLPSHIWAGGTVLGRQVSILVAKLTSCYNEFL